MTRTAFPDGFLWGVATSAYQIEGGATADGRGPSIWDTFSHIRGNTLGGDTGDVAADHYNRVADDVALMAGLGLRMYRFSVSWPRVVPDGDGAVNSAGLAFYDRLVDMLLAAGIEPMVTLYHWDLPQTLQDAGGWQRRQTADDFARYAGVVFGALHDRVQWWATHNEPWVAAYLGHYAGIFAPGLAGTQAALSAHHHLLLGHGRAVQTMREIDARPAQGIIMNLERAEAIVDGPEVHDGVRRFEGLMNRAFCDPVFASRYPADVIADLAPDHFPVDDGDLEVISTPLDWLGVNFYRPWFLEPAVSGEPTLGDQFPGCEHVRNVTAGRPATDMDWPVEPHGLIDILTWLAATYPNLPALFLSENGAAYDDPITSDGQIHDTRRIAYLESHIAALRAAMAAGADVRGYLVWSLLDNFEWSSGYSKRFGLVHVDYDTLVRTPRQSANWYRDLIARNGSAVPAN